MAIVHGGDIKKRIIRSNWGGKGQIAYKLVKSIWKGGVAVSRRAPDRTRFAFPVNHDVPCCYSKASESVLGDDLAIDTEVFEDELPFMQMRERCLENCRQKDF